MDVNGVTTGYSANVTNSNYSSSAAVKDDAEEKKDGFSDVAATYEHTSASNKTYTQNTDLIKQLKADAEARTSQLRSLVEEMMTKQGSAFGTANSDDDMWKFLAKGDFTVDAAAKKAAQEAISENGYWGVNQTSERILSFAKALTGGDPSKVEEMRDAFEKGFSQATKAWGQNLPDISSKTYDAVMEGFDNWAKEGV